EGHYRSTYEIFIGQARALDSVMQGEFQGFLNGEETVIRLPERFAIIPASRSLERLDEVVLQSRGLRPEINFERALADLAASFDYVFVDTAPNLTRPTVIAYNTVPWFVLTARPGKTAMDSLSDAVQDLLHVKTLGAEGRLLGVV